VHACREHAAIGEAEDGRGQRRHLAHGLGQRQPPVPDHVVLDHPREAAVPAWVERSRAAVGGDGDERIGQQPRLQRLVHHEVGRGSAVRADHVDQQVLERHLALERDLGQRPAGPRPRAEQRGTGTVALLHAGPEPARELVAPLALRAREILLRLRPGREQDRDAGIARRVRVQVGRDLDARLPRGLQEREDLVRACRTAAVDGFEMRDVHARVLAERQKLRDRGM